jgi:hypothetical protein
VGDGPRQHPMLASRINPLWLLGGGALLGGCGWL